jgi:phospholipid transport system transporter-binding protein
MAIGASVNGASLESLGGGRFKLSGRLNANSVVSVLKESHRRFEETKTVDVDLGGVTESDSSGLALLLEWLRLSRIADRAIHFTNLPAQIGALARISEVEDLVMPGGDHGSDGEPREEGKDLFEAQQPA